MAHRETIKEYLKKVSIQNQDVIDWGRGTKPITKYCQGVPFKYFGIDKLDHVDADLVTDMSKFMELYTLYDTAFCMESLEHVERPDVLIENIYRHLKVGGFFYFSVPFLYPIHSEEDYWRYTDQGLKLLIGRHGFTVLEVLPTEDNMGWVGRAIKLSPDSVATNVAINDTL